MDLGLILIFVLLMVIVVHPSACLERFGWKGGDPCESIPFPFGIHGRALPGFELNCSAGEAYLLPTKNQSYLIEEISTNTVTIAAQFMYKICNSENGSEMVEHNYGLSDIAGTPYTISGTANELSLFGCDELLILHDFSQNDTFYQLEIGCAVFCNSLAPQTECSGLGCCKASLPRDGLKRFDLEVDNITEHTDYTITYAYSMLSSCSVAFIGKQGTADSITSYGLGDNPPLFQLLTLEWAIGNNTCQEAKKQPETYLCKENADCYDSHTNFSGYYCNCSNGFQGNPYSSGGCTDIDECTSPDMNPCAGRCINEIGNVSCSCPRGLAGDGRKDGSGCRIPLDLTLGLVFGSLLILITSSFCIFLSCQRRKLTKMRAKFFQQNGGFLLKQLCDSEGIDSRRKIFTAEQLKKATDNYNETQVLGQGGFGTVYKGVLKGNGVVAIKKAKLSDGSQVEQFINEILLLSQINHRNVVMLLGCCLETEVPMLVYEFVPNGTLFDRIHAPISLPWKERLQIAADVAGALAYLHSAASPPIIHRDIKSTNILLDNKHAAKISDFGASRSVPFEKTHVTTVVQGTFGYLDPEYFTTHQLTEKSDVYSFGVVLAELWLREKPISLDRPIEIQGLAAYFTTIVSERQLAQAMEPYVLEEAGVEQIGAIGRLTTRCLSSTGEERPTMREVASELERLRQAVEQESSARMDANVLVPFLNGPGIIEGQCSGSSHLCVKEEEMSRRYSLETSMLSSMELPR